MADFNVLFREEQESRVVFRGDRVYRWDVVFSKGEEALPIVFTRPEGAIPVTFHEDGVNDRIFGGVDYVVHDYGDLPIATRQSPGCVIVGENLSVQKDGTLSADAARVDALTNLEIEELLGGT